MEKKFIFSEIGENRKKVEKREKRGQRRTGVNSKKGGVNPMVLYCTIDLWDIKIYIFFGKEAQKRQYF